MFCFLKVVFLLFCPFLFFQGKKKNIFVVPFFKKIKRLSVLVGGVMMLSCMLKLMFVVIYCLTTVISLWPVPGSPCHLSIKSRLSLMWRRETRSLNKETFTLVHNCCHLACSVCPILAWDVCLVLNNKQYCALFHAGGKVLMFHIDMIIYFFFFDQYPILKFYWSFLISIVVGGPISWPVDPIWFCSPNSVGE